MVFIIICHHEGNFGLKVRSPYQQPCRETHVLVLEGEALLSLVIQLQGLMNMLNKQLIGLYWGLTYNVWPGYQ